MPHYSYFYCNIVTIIFSKLHNNFRRLTFAGVE